MATTLHFELNTEPMGQSLLTVANAVEGTTQTVGAAAQHVAEAEDRAAARVSTNITTGFHNLILSQLNQKKAVKFASVQAKDAHLVSEKTTAQNLELQFLQDFQRIKNRYVKLFDSLNRTLKSRIAELDKPVFQVVDKDYRKGIFSRINSIGLPVISSIECSDASRQLTIGKTKGKIIRLLSEIKDYLEKTMLLRKRVSSVLLPRRLEERVILSLPYLVMVADGFVKGTETVALNLPDAPDEVGLVKDLKVGINSTDYLGGSWEDLDTEGRLKIDSQFGALLGKSNLTEREKETAQALYRESRWQVLKAVHA